MDEEPDFIKVLKSVGKSQKDGCKHNQFVLTEGFFRDLALGYKKGVNAPSPGKFPPPTERSKDE